MLIVINSIKFVIFIKIIIDSLSFFTTIELTLLEKFKLVTMPSVSSASKALASSLQAYLELKEGIRVFDEERLPSILNSAQVLGPHTKLAEQIVEVTYGLIQASPFLKSLVSSASQGFFSEKLIVQGERVLLQVPDEVAESITKLYRTVQDSHKRAKETGRPSIFFRNPELLSALDYFGLPLFGQALVEATDKELKRLIEICQEIRHVQEPGAVLIQYPISNEQCLKIFRALAPWGTIQFHGNEVEYIVDLHSLLKTFEFSIRTFSSSQLVRLLGAYSKYPALFSFIVDFLGRRDHIFLKRLSPHQLGDLFVFALEDLDSLTVLEEQAKQQDIDLRQIPLAKFHEAFLESTRLGHNTFNYLCKFSQTFEIPLFQSIPHEIKIEAFINVLGTGSLSFLNAFLDQLPGGLASLHPVSPEKLGRVLIAFASSNFDPNSEMSTRVRNLIQELGGIETISNKHIKEAWKKGVTSTSQRFEKVEWILSPRISLITPDEYARVLLGEAELLSDDFFEHLNKRGGEVNLSPGQVSQMLSTLTKCHFKIDEIFNYLRRKGQLKDISEKSLNDFFHTLTLEAKRSLKFSLSFLNCLDREQKEKLSDETLRSLFTCPNLGDLDFQLVIKLINTLKKWDCIDQKCVNRAFINNVSCHKNLAIFLDFIQKSAKTLQLSSKEVEEAFVRSVESPNGMGYLIELLSSTGQLSEISTSCIEKALSNCSGSFFNLEGEGEQHPIEMILELLEKRLYPDLSLSFQLCEALARSARISYLIFSRFFKYFEAKGELVNLHPQHIMKMLYHICDCRSIQEVQEFMTLLSSSSTPLLESVSAEDLNACFVSVIEEEEGGVNYDQKLRNLNTILDLLKHTELNL